MNDKVKMVTIRIELPGDPTTFSKSISAMQANAVQETIEEVKGQIAHMLDVEHDMIHGSDTMFKVKGLAKIVKATVQIGRKQVREDK